MAHTLRLRLSAFVLTTVCLPLLTPSTFADSTPQQRLDALLERYDRAPDGPVKERLAAEIDAAAHQKYASVSRLFWYTDFASAKAAAHESGRPILHLRMLGRLDEDLSCANSRLFRTTLYADQDVSRFLREHFVLYWSSERPVQRVQIEYGVVTRMVITPAGT